jgi:hypothetical protein
VDNPVGIGWNNTKAHEILAFRREDSKHRVEVKGFKPSASTLRTWRNYLVLPDAEKLNHPTALRIIAASGNQVFLPLQAS